MKICSVCNLEKEESEFYKTKSVKCGLTAACKICVGKRQTKWPKENREKSNAAKKAWKERNREEYLAQQREYAKEKYSKNVEKEKVRHKEWIKNNPQVYKESCKKSAAKTFQKYKKEIIEKRRIYRENNREKCRERSRLYKAKNYEKVMQAHKEYWERYPEKYKAHRAVNNALVQGVLIKPSNCEVCNKKGHIEGHHEDYTKMLEVKWLCRECHNKAHGK